MQIKRRAITVGTTFFLAAATGHVMQNGDAISARLRGEAPQQPVLASVQATAATTPQQAAAAEPVVPVTEAAMTPAPEQAPASAEPAVAAATEASQVPAVAEPSPVIAAASADPAVAEPGMALPDAAPKPVLTASGLPDLPKVEPAALGTDVKLAGRVEQLDTGYSRPDTAADANYSVFGLACADPTLSLEPTARAMIKVTLAAPCFANERVTISHAGLAFTMATDLAGDLEVMLPAMVENAAVEARFASGDAVSAIRAVTGLDALARIAVQWQGGERFHLHVFENGAGFDMPGHVSIAAPRDRSTSEGGFLTPLGDPAVDHPRMAEVYTAPAGTPVDEMIVEALVNDATCGRLVSGRTFRASATAASVPEPLSLAMPDCDAIGDSVLLPLSPVTVPAVALAQGGN